MPLLFGARSALAIALLLVCQLALAESPYQKLPSGKTIKVKNIGKVYTTKGANWVLILEYETALPLSDVSSLKEEAIDVWGFFKPIAEQSGFRYAAIRASEPAKGTFVQQYESFTHLLVKQADGNWVFREKRTQE